MIFRRIYNESIDEIDKIKRQYKNYLKENIKDLIFFINSQDYNCVPISDRNEALELCCELIRKEILYNMIFASFGLLRPVVNIFENLDGDLFQESNEILNLKNKCILCNVYKPSKYFNDIFLHYELNFMKYRVGSIYYYKNLKIGYITSGGNHRMFLQMIRNEDNDANVIIKDDLYLLENYDTDGYYLISKADNSKFIIGDYRVALLFKLTQIKLGIVEFL